MRRAICFSENVSNVLAPDFTGTDVTTENTVKLSDYIGKAVLLNFVNYGCDQRTNQVVSEQLLAIKDLYESRNDFEPLSVFCGMVSAVLLYTKRPQLPIPGNPISGPFPICGGYNYTHACGISSLQKVFKTDNTGTA